MGKKGKPPRRQGQQGGIEVLQPFSSLRCSSFSCLLLKSLNVSTGRHVTGSEARDKTRVLLTARAAVQSHSHGRVSPDKDANKQGSWNRYGVAMTTSQKLSGKNKHIWDGLSCRGSCLPFFFFPVSPQTGRCQRQLHRRGSKSDFLHIRPDHFHPVGPQLSRSEHLKSIPGATNTVLTGTEVRVPDRKSSVRVLMYPYEAWGQFHKAHSCFQNI